MNRYELKNKLRVELLQKRELLEPSQICAANLRGDLLTKSVLERYHPFKVGIYWPKGPEFPTQRCIFTLCNAGVEIYLPVVSGNDMDFYRFTGEENLSKGSFGVLIPPVEESSRVKPDEIDVLIVPGVAFDRQLQRLGYGKGYYDRYLTKLRASTVKIGLAYNFQVLDQIPHTEADQPVDLLFTETEERL